MSTVQPARHTGATMLGRNPDVPREWFLVPLFVINEAVEKIKDGTISSYIYDPHWASLKRAG
jgi:hypothetical protein